MDHLTPQFTISVNSTVAAAKGQISADLADEVVILDIESGIYYGLDAIGTRIWHLIQAPRAVKDIQDTLLEEYEVDPDRCGQELLALLRDLASHGLVEVKDGAGA